MINVILYDTGDSREENNEPLGIEVIGARLLKEYGSQVQLKLLWFNKDGILPLDGEEIDIIGVSLNIKRMDVFDTVYNKVKMLKHIPWFFVGNVAATYGYQELLQKYPDIICMLGEGEEIYPDIVRQFLTENAALERINNLAYIKAGKVFETERKPADLNHYVKPLRVFTDFLIKNKGIARIEGSRGCVWNKCSFCCVNFKYNYLPWRAIRIETVLEQIEELAVSGIKSVYFTDEDFVGSDRCRLKKFIEEISERRKNNHLPHDINYFISVKPGDILNAETFKLLQDFTRVGLREVFIGIESGCDSQLKRYGKCTTAAMNGSVLDKAKALDADVDIGFILFDPEMTVEDLLENIDFIDRHRLYEYGSNFIKRLRIQSFTALESHYSAPEKLKFDLDNLEYSYRFQDDRIEKIYSLYENLKTDFDAYQIQNVYRGEIETESLRKLYKEKLTALRELQFTALKRIVQSVLTGKPLLLDDIFSQRPG